MKTFSQYYSEASNLNWASDNRNIQAIDQIQKTPGGVPVYAMKNLKSDSGGKILRSSSGFAYPTNKDGEDFFVVFKTAYGDLEKSCTWHDLGPGDFDNIRIQPNHRNFPRVPSNNFS